MCSRTGIEVDDGGGAGADGPAVGGATSGRCGPATVVEEGRGLTKGCLLGRLATNVALNPWNLVRRELRRNSETSKGAGQGARRGFLEIITSSRDTLSSKAEQCTSVQVTASVHSSGSAFRSRPAIYETKKRVIQHYFDYNLYCMHT